MPVEVWTRRGDIIRTLHVIVIVIANVIVAVHVIVIANVIVIDQPARARLRRPGEQPPAADASFAETARRLGRTQPNLGSAPDRGLF